MFEKLRELYEAKKLDAAALGRAVKKGWLSPQQLEEILKN